MRYPRTRFALFKLPNSFPRITPTKNGKIGAGYFRCPQFTPAAKPRGILADENKISAS